MKPIAKGYWSMAKAIDGYSLWLYPLHLWWWQFGVALEWSDPAFGCIRISA